MLSSQADSWENHCRQLPNLMSKASTLRELLKRGAVAPPFSIHFGCSGFLIINTGT
jgi:hypothetical protein